MESGEREILGREDTMRVLGEVIHTSLRKGSDHYRAHAAWRAIEALPDAEWESVLDFLQGALEVEGINLTREPAGNEN